MHQNNYWLRGFLSLSVFFTLSCSKIWVGSEKAQSHFIKNPDKLVQYSERSPFDGSYYPDVKKFYQLKPNYRCAFIAPVSVDLVKEALHLSSLPESTKKIRSEEAEEVARYMTEKLASSFKEYKDHPMKIVSKPGKGCLEMDIALTEVSPTNPAINLAASAAGVLVPGGGLTRVFGTGRVTMEGRVLDSSTQELFVEFRDSRRDKTSPFSVRDFQQYAHIRVTVEDWAQELAQLAATPLEVKVEGASFFTFNPF